MNTNNYLQFFGAAQTTTGSKYLISTAGQEQLLLECGLFQGGKSLRQRNWQTPPFDLKRLQAVVLSHAHIDHSGYLPLIVRQGWRGPIYCSHATAELLGELLPDAAYLQEEEAEYANYQGYSKHKPALPLYTQDDAHQTLKQLVPQAMHQPFQPLRDISVTYHYAGHILGAAIVSLQFKPHQQRLVFSGDLGRRQRPLLPDPETLSSADCLILESTYGDRQHAHDAEAQLKKVIEATVSKGGALIVPAFAVGRTQELLWILRSLTATGQIPFLPIYIDSPMATAVTKIYERYPQDQEVTAADKAIAKQLRHKMQVTFVGDRQQSIALNRINGPCIIISASGMATGGRVLHHLAQRLPDKRTTVLLTGFQAEGTRGRSLQEGCQRLRLHGKEVPVRAEIKTLDGLSAHADQPELLHWLSYFKQPPAQLYLVHGEVAASSALQTAIQERFGWKAKIAAPEEKIKLFERRNSQ